MVDFTSFKLHLRRKERAQTTVDQYLFILGFMYRETKFNDLDSYFLKKIDSGSNPNSINNIINVLRLYGRFSSNEYLINLEPFGRRKSYKDTLSDSEIEALYTMPPGKTGRFAEVHKRTNLMWKCLAFSGARPGEIAALKIDYVDFGGTLFHLDGKTGERKAAINPLLIPNLIEHIKTLKGEYLFPSMYDVTKPLSRISWNKDFGARIKKLGIRRKGVSAHSLRHSFITRNWRQGILFIQKQVGHKKLETTAGYAHLVIEDLIEGIKEDRLGRSELPYAERFSDVWNKLKKIIDVACKTPEEEKQMRQDLLNLL